ncbi:MAG TPA: hypothetical protein VJ862_13350 [Rhodanobacteraceae bacterium]|nr:hypothetical protein [Rhodanobacteraceae bacterium]
MTAETFLDEMARARIKLTADGDRLRFVAPESMNAHWRARLIEHKAEILPLVAMRDRLLALARTVDVPDEIVTSLPASELRACIDQLPLWDGDELRTRVPVFYLRGLAGLEPAPAGSPADKRRTS